MTFGEPGVVQSLKLTELQRRAIRQIEVESVLMPGERPDLTDKAARDALRTSLFQSAMEKCLALLAPEQSAKWKELVGPPLRGSLSHAPPGVPPGPD